MDTNKSGVVLDGYDVVSYRADDKAVEGTEKYMAKYDGVKFYFKTQEHKKLFLENPKKYAPQYHGYCAFAVAAKNAKVPANADTFKMYNGKLLVFFNDLYDGNKFNTKILWNNNEKQFSKKAEMNWKTLR